MKLASGALILLLGTPAFAGEAAVEDVLRAAEAAGPELKAAAAREAQARDAVELGKSYYYPTLEAEGLQTYGFQGSNGSLGLAGIMSSPFRSGPTGGLASRLTLVDWSRGYGVRAARSRLAAARAQTRVARYTLDRAALRLYLEAARDRGQTEAWRSVGEEAAKALKEVERLVRTGQHSPVERMLVQDQVDDAAMQAAAFAKRYRIQLKRLALLTRMSEAGLSCPNPLALSEASLAAISPGAASPFVERAQAEAATAKDVAAQRRAANYPILTALGSVGGMDQARLVGRIDYSAGFGIKLPLFEGFRTSSEIADAEDAADELEALVLSARLDLDEADASYDEIIESSRIKLEYLERESANTEKGLDLAESRYRAFEGPLVDVRESIRNLARILTQRNDVKTDLLRAVGAKALLNGGSVRGTNP